MVEELAKVLARPIPKQRLELLGKTAGELLTDYIEAIDLVTPLFTPSVVLADSDDDHVIAAAVAARADMIVSGDRHLLALKRHQTIRIMPPADAYRTVTSGGKDR
jgi:predicted nucleic acid-binding protein